MGYPEGVNARIVTCNSGYWLRQDKHTREAGFHMVIMNRLKR